MRIPWRRLLWLGLAAIPLLVVGAIVWNSTRDLSSYQARLAEQVRKATGRALTTRVPLSVRLGSEPALVAEGVTLSNASWGSRPELARVRRLTMFLDPFALLLGEARAGRLVLEGADILIERNDAGDSNLEMLPPPDGSGPHPSEHRSLKQRANPAFPWIGIVEVRDSVLTVAQGQGRPPVVLEIASASMKSGAPNQPLQIEARLAAPHATPLDLTGTAGTFDGWMRGLPGNIDLQGGFGGGTVGIKGTIGVKGTNLQITGEGPDIAVFGPYVRLPLPSGGPYALTAKAGTVRSNFKVEVASLKVGGSELSGEALFRTDRHGVPTVSVNIEAAKIDAASLRAGPAARAADQAALAQPRFLPTMPFSLSWLGRSNVSFTARVGEVTGLSGKVHGGSVTLASSESRFTFRAAASIGAGSAGFDLIYDPAGRLGQATFTATASRVPIEDLAAVLGLDLGVRDGTADIDLRLRGSGRNTRDALNASSGAIDVALGKGVWPAGGLAGWPNETQRLLATGDGNAPFNCLAGRFEVSGGVANLRRLVVDTPRATWVGGGFLQFRSESWEAILVPEARDAPGMALASPVRLKGGTGRPTSGALEPALSKLVIGGGAVPSLTAALNQASRQPGANACSAMAPRVDGLRPGLRAQFPVPAAGSGRRGVPDQPPRN